MRRAVVAFACAMLVMALAAPAHAANGQLVAVAGGKLVAVNPDGTGLRTLWAPTGEITGLAFAPDGNSVAFSYAGKITILDFTTRSINSQIDPPVGSVDVDPAWVRTTPTSPLRIAFRRIGPAGQKQMRLIPGAATIVAESALSPIPEALAIAPNGAKWAVTLLGGALLIDPISALQIELGVSGTPAWSADGSKLAYMYGNTLRVAENPGLAGMTKLDVTSVQATAPRFSPDADALVFLANGQARTVPVRAGATPTSIPNLAGVTAIDWQPCVQATVSCYSSVPPACTTNTAQVTTQADRPVQLPAAPCNDPSSLPLSFVLVKGPDNGTLAGTVYTPNAGFSGQDTVTYKVSNGFAESEVIKVLIFVVPRAAGAGPPSVVPSPVGPVAPFLSLRVKPRLDRKRTTTARLTCDQACTFTVRLQGTVRVKKKTKAIKGAVLKRALEPGRVLALKLKFPKKPVGTLKTAWIIGTVHGADGTTRAVKLPVAVPR